VSGAEARPREPDRAPQCPHPRETFDYIGHDAQEAELAAALASETLHHAWLITGPKGVGKASLAYRAARVALGAKPCGPRALDVDADDPVARRIAGRAHPDLFVLRRDINERTGRARRDITADEARGLGGFFALAPALGGRRVAIVDAVDDLGRHGANAILKTLEEPPPRALILLVCHAPGAALATIRSRCRRLTLRELGEAPMREAFGDAPGPELLALAKGRPGRARALLAQGFERLGDGMARELMRLERGEARQVLTKLYAEIAGEADEKLAAVIEIASDWVRARALETCAETWADAWSQLEELRAEADGLDMDPRHALARVISLLDRAGAARR